MSSNRFDGIRAIEACYAPARDEREWLAGLAHAFLPLASGLGLIASAWELTAGRARRRAAATAGHFPVPLAQADEAWSAAPADVVEGWFAATPLVDTARQRLRRLGDPAFARPLEAAARFGVIDALMVVAREPGGRCVHVACPSREVIRIGPRALHRLARVAVHLGTASRLRALAEPRVEAVLDGSGRVLHAEGAARAPAARASLATAVRQTERAKGRLRRSDPGEALELWRGLVEGRWSLVEHVEADGRRLVLARRNGPGAPDPKALSARERDVLAHVVQGQTNKHVAHALGLSATTVAAHLRRALGKLGVGTRNEVIALLSGTSVRRRTPTPDPEVR